MFIFLSVKVVKDNKYRIFIFQDCENVLCFLFSFIFFIFKSMVNFGYVFSYKVMFNYVFIFFFRYLFLNIYF